jgi:hypothetical protein
LLGEAHADRGPGRGGGLGGAGDAELGVGRGEVLFDRPRRDPHRYNTGVGFKIEIKGRSIAAVETGTDSMTGGTAKYTITGSFSAPNAFSGTAKKEVTGSSKDPSPHSCKTPTVKFSFHAKG